MPELSANRAVEIAESPWEDPEDGMLCGTYRVAIADDPFDHLVVYLRLGDPEEYIGATTICGKLVTFGVRRVSETCEACLTGAGPAFLAARDEILRRAGA